MTLGINELKDVLKIVLRTSHIRVYKNGIIKVGYRFKPGVLSSNPAEGQALANGAKASISETLNLTYKVHTVEKTPHANYRVYVNALKAPCPPVSKGELKSLLRYFTDSRRTSLKSVTITLTPPSPEAFYDALAIL
jgi:hypothetical protein